MGGDQGGEAGGADQRHKRGENPVGGFGSRLPVGSSARSRMGALATARAMATRCCSPPESCGGTMATAFGKAEIAEQLICALPRLGRLEPGDHLRRHDILHRRKFRQQMVESGRRSRYWTAQGWCARDPSCPKSAKPSISTSPSSGFSSSPAICSKVDLPAPEGATNATACPGYKGRFSAAEDFQKAFAFAVAADDAAQPQRRLHEVVIHGAEPPPDRAAPRARRDRWSRGRRGPGS